MIDTERYIQMVRDLGVEEAYKQRFRSTGRTFRDVCEIGRRVSAGEKLHIIGSATQVDETLRQVVILFDTCSVPAVSDYRRVELTVNTGSVTGYTIGQNIRGIRSTEYKLHDC